MTELHATDPSQTIGNHNDPRVELEAAMAEVLPLLEPDMDNAEQAFAEYVHRRSTDLPHHGTDTIGHAYATFTDRFIGPETPMVGSGLLDKAFYFDDESAYTAAYATLRQGFNFLKEKLPPEKAYLNAAIAAANFGQAYYFQSYVGDLAKRGTVTGDYITDDDDEDDRSIANLKQVAVCQERAGVAHNTLLILGVTSRFEGGRLESMDSDGNKSDEAHAFIVVTNLQGDEYIFDPTNPIVHRNEGGAIEHVRPAIYKIKDPTTDRQTVELKEFIKSESGEEIEHARELTYYFGITPIDQRLV